VSFTIAAARTALDDPNIAAAAANVATAITARLPQARSIMTLSS
jgi:hypothetical protein